MGKRLIDHGVNIITLIKNNQKMAMTCAWAMQVDYDKIVCLIGSQSVTGKNIEKNDLIGVSILSKENMDLANIVGDTHSDEVDKFANNDFIDFKGVKVVQNAPRYANGKVIDVLHLEGIEEDYLVYILIEEVVESDTNDFLHMSDYK